MARNTSAIHYLLKYWPEEAQIMVIHEYHVYAKSIKRYISKKERNYLKNGYSFVEDGIPVNMVELPLFPKQKKLFRVQKKYMVTKVNSILRKASFIPDIIICHQPTCYVGQYIDELNYSCKKIAVLHVTDSQYCERDPRFADMISTYFDSVYCRTKNLYRTFLTFNIPNLKEELVESGVPLYETHIEKHWNGSLLNIVYVGKLTKRKHVDDIINALVGLSGKRKFHFSVIGSGPEEENLKHMCAQYNMEESVTFVGTLSREGVYEYLGKSDLFVMPSTGETLGLVYLEAMRQKCIPIGTKGEGIDGIIVDGVNGFLVPPCDSEILKTVIEKLLSADAMYLKNISDKAKATGDLYDERTKGLQYYKMVCAAEKTTMKS